MFPGSNGRRWPRIYSRFIAPARSKKPGSGWMNLPSNGMGAIRRSARCASELGILDAVLRLSGGHKEGDLYHQRNRVVEHVAAKSDQDSGIVSQSGGRPQAAVPSLGAHREKVDHAGAK